MSGLIGPDPFFYPSLGLAVLPFIRFAYGLLLTATLLAALPHARRYFLTERWGGYAQAAPWTDRWQNPVVMPLLIAVWLGAAIALTSGVAVVPAALVNVVLCRYFFIQMRWRGVLRGMGAPGFIAYWLGVAVLLLEYTHRFAPGLNGLALLVLHVDFALIMLSAGAYKFFAGYRRNDGMELGMVNPEWGYWHRFWRRKPFDSGWFRFFNEMAWGTEVVAAVLMLFPPTRLAGGLLILLSFVFIATQIRLGFLCEMVIVCCLLFAHDGSFVDLWLRGWLVSAPVPAGPSSPALTAALTTTLWGYLLLLPFARAGLGYNFYGRKVLPGALQRALDLYVNVFGLIIWRVFSADLTNFFVRIYEQRRDGSRQLVSRWGSALRYRQVAESITVTSIFTTLKYYPSNPELFRERLLRYARTVPYAPGGMLIFEYVSVCERNRRFEFVPVMEYSVDPRAGTVSERTLDTSITVEAPSVSSPIHEAARPGTYAPLRP